MPDFKGRLTVINSQSTLDDLNSTDDSLLLRAGIPDPTQAIFAATQFLLKTKKLVPGQMIVVTGSKGTFGQVSVIVMTDARADTAQPFLVAASDLTLAAASAPVPSGTKSRRVGSKKGGAAKGSKKGGGSKAVSGPRKRGSKSGAAKKGAAPRKGGAVDSSEE
jgi:hypothetical protein